MYECVCCPWTRGHSRLVASELSIGGGEPGHRASRFWKWRLILLAVVGGGVIGAGDGKERAAEKQQDESPFPEAAGVVAALTSAD